MEPSPNVDGGHGSTPLLAGTDQRQAGSVTPIVVFSTLVAVLGSFVFGSAVGYTSPAQSGIMDDLSLSSADYSLFGSMLTIGAILASMMGGLAADLLGRRAAMGISDLFCLAGWLAIVFSKSAWWLDIGRLLLGFGIGILSYVIPVYIAEITPKNVRGAFTAVNQLMVCLGVSVMYLIGFLIKWHILALAGSIPCLLQLVGLFFIPESPRWLAKVSRWKDCETSLQQLRGKNANIYLEAAEIREYTETLQQFSGSRLIDLFQGKYAHSLLVGVCLMVFQQLGGVTAITYYVGSIFESAGFSSRTGTIAMVFVQVPGSILGTFLTDRSGRRPLLLVSLTGTCLGCFLLAVSFILQDLQHWQFSPVFALVGVLVFIGSFGIGMGGIPSIIMSEIFPINVKGFAGSLVTLVNWLGTFVISYSFNFLSEWSPAGTFFLFSFFSASAIVFVAKLVPETKGFSLEEIQASMVLFTSRSRKEILNAGNSL